jgi:hypothetical protein
MSSHLQTAVVLGDFLGFTFPSAASSVAAQATAFCCFHTQRPTSSQSTRAVRIAPISISAKYEKQLIATRSKNATWYVGTADLSSSDWSANEFNYRADIWIEDWHSAWDIEQ